MTQGGRGRLLHSGGSYVSVKTILQKKKQKKPEQYDPTSTLVTEDDLTNDEVLLCQNTATPGQDIFLFY